MVEMSTMTINSPDGEAITYEVVDKQARSGLANKETNGTAESKVSAHNTNTSAHNDIRLLIEGLTTRLNALANSDDTTLDQMAEVVTYIKSNRTLIEEVTTNKVNVSDIINNLTTNVTNKPLSAAQGVTLKSLIDTLQTAVNNIKVPTKTSELTNDSGFLTQHQDLSAYAKTSQIPTKVSQLTNDSKFLTAVPSEYVTETELTAKGYAKQTEVSQLSEEIADLKSGNIEIPDYWQTHLDGKISAIKTHQDEAGKDGFSFIVIADPHVANNLAKLSPILAKKIMDECNIRYPLVLGDMQNRGSVGSKATAEAEWEVIKTMFKPISDSMLMQKGNHDGSWGNTLDGVTYPYNFTPEEMHNRVYANTYRHHNAVTDESGTGYYVDDTANKVRYILLNTHCNPYEENANGSAKYNNMKMFRFTQSQYDFLIEALMNMEDGWAVMIGTHAPIVEAYQDVWGGANSDFIVMRNLLKAYKNKTAYNGSWAGTNGYDAISVSVDFDGAKGEFIGYFSGHMHNDYTYKASDGYGIDIITTRCDGAAENGSLVDERVAGTITEQCFDVFTVNRKTSTIYATRIGAGSDRIISIGGVVIPTYTVTNTLTNCTNSNGSTVIEKGKAYSGTISAKTGYQLQSVTVKMGGTDITSTAYSNGVITIGNVTGDIVITASAKADTYTVTNKLTGCTTSNSASSVAHGSTYKATITANADYELETVKVTMGGTDITSSAYSNGTINISSVTGNIVITATAIETVAYVNLFDKNGTGFSDQTSKFYTNWMPYNEGDNGGTGTIYHIKGLVNSGNNQPYKMQFKTNAGDVSSQVYCTNANVKAIVKADYDANVVLVQHDTNSTEYTMIQFEIREAVPANLIITANQNIVD